jgi:hypothetical protein
MDRVKAALFVDFDNIYSGLMEVEERAAQAFATLPGQWLEWLERRSGDGGAGGNGAGPPRNILIRNMYLNPSRFGRFRADFTRAGFSVMDCPSLTLQGKSSADIRMVLDIVDTLEHRTQFDEFIIFSGDADFTPLLQRLRAHDRRTAILAVGPAAQAYKAAADALIDEDAFVEQALRLHIGGDPSRLVERPGQTPAVPVALLPARQQPTNGTTEPVSDVLDRMAARLRREVDLAGRVLAASLPRIFREFPEFTRAANWLGYNSLRRLVEQIVPRDVHLEIEGAENQSWVVRRRVAAVVPSAAGSPGAGSIAALRPEELAPATIAASVVPAPSAAPPSSSTAIDPVALADRMMAIVRRVVAEASKPVPLGSAAHAVADDLGPVAYDSHWAGHGSFKSLLTRHLSETLAVADTAPGYVYDPARHAALLPPDGDHLDGQPSQLAALARRVFNVTGAPYLSPGDYSTLFDTIAEAVKSAPFQIGTTSVIAREACDQRGCAISRQTIQFVIKGILFGGHKLGDEAASHEPLALAVAFRDNIRKLCKNAQMVLSDEELALLDAWLLGSQAPGTIDEARRALR